MPFTSLLLAIFCASILLAVPPESPLSAECRQRIEQLNTKADTTSIASALGIILGPPEKDPNYIDRVGLLIKRLPTKKIPEAEVTRLLGVATAKLLAAHEIPSSRALAIERARALLDGLDQAQDLASLVAALRHEGPAAEKLFKQLAKQARARVRPAPIQTPKAEPKPEVSLSLPPPPVLDDSAVTHLIPMRNSRGIPYRSPLLVHVATGLPPVHLQEGWTDGKRLGLPTLFTPHVEEANYRGKSQRTKDFEKHAVQWIREQGELLYAVGTDQLSEVYGMAGKKNVDALSVSEDSSGPLLNIREFKLSINSLYLSHATWQFQSTLHSLLALNPQLRIGKLELLHHYGESPQDVRLRVNGKEYTIHFRQLPLPETSLPVPRWR